MTRVRMVICPNCWHLFRPKRITKQERVEGSSLDVCHHCFFCVNLLMLKGELVEVSA